MRSWTATPIARRSTLSALNIRSRVSPYDATDRVSSLAEGLVMTTRDDAATLSLRHVAASYIARAKTICIKMSVASRLPAISLEIARHARGIHKSCIYTRCSRTRAWHVPIKTYVNFSKADLQAKL